MKTKNKINHFPLKIGQTLAFGSGRFHFSPKNFHEHKRNWSYDHESQTGEKFLRIFIGADHAGFKLKGDIIKYLKTLRISFDDLGTSSDARVDYPDFAFRVADAVAKNKNARGILICGTGTGMVIAANKVRGIRAALIYDNYTARMAREHNDANIACLRGRKFPIKKALKILKVWLQTSFSKELRHKQRLQKISKYEEKFHACLP